MEMEMSEASPEKNGSNNHVLITECALITTYVCQVLE